MPELSHNNLNVQQPAHYTFGLLATNPRPLQDLCRLVIRKTLGPQGSKRLHGLPLPPALIMYLNYFHEFRQG